MGRRTWEGIPAQHRPLKGRVNVVLSRGGVAGLPEGVLQASSLQASLGMIAQLSNVESAVVIGGVQLFEEAVAHSSCVTAHVTRVHQGFPCDTYLPRAFQGLSVGRSIVQ